MNTNLSESNNSLPMPPPVLPAAEGGRIDPARIDESIGAQVDITWPGITDFDRVTIYWTGREQTSFTDRRTARGGKVTFFIPKTPHISGNNGGEVQLKYTVTPAIGGVAHSAPLILHVDSKPWLDSLTTFSTGLEGWRPGETGGRGGTVLFSNQLGRWSFYNWTEGVTGFSGPIISRAFDTVVGRRQRHVHHRYSCPPRDLTARPAVPDDGGRASWPNRRPSPRPFAQPG